MESPQSEDQLHPDPDINKYLKKLTIPGPGHLDVEGKISDPENRRMEVANKLSSISMQRELRRNADPSFVSELEKASLKLLINRFPDQKNYVHEVVQNSDSLKSHANDSDLFGNTSENQ